jgi:hypothetical protein
VDTTERRGRRRTPRGTAAVSALLLLSALAVGLVGTPTPAAGAVEEPTSCLNPSTEATATPISTGWGKVGVFNDNTQLFPAQLGAAFYANHGASDAHACVARNSFGAFQVAVTATGAAATINGVGASDLIGPGGAVLSADKLRFYREGIVSLGTMSDASFRTDLLPRNTAGECTGDCRMFDALVPTVEPGTGAARAVYPEQVPANETRVLWVDVLAPAGQPAGTYQGTVTLEVNGADVPVPVAVRVVDKTIPSPGSAQATAQGTDLTSEFRLRSAGGMSWTKFVAYARLGLENRISVWRDGSPGMSEAEWAQVSDLLEGTDGGVRLAGSQLQNVAITKWTSAADITSLRTRLTSIAQADKAWFWCDEVAVSTCSTDVGAARAHWQTLPLVAIPKLLAYDPLTHPNGAEGDLNAIDNIRGLVPLSTYLHPQASKSGLNPYASKTSADRSPAFTAWRDEQPGREFWAYISCMSEGCNAPYTPQGIYSGWPSYAIDHAGSTQSALGWQAFRYGFTAEHYWSANFCADATAGAELNSCLYANDDGAGSNGDGNLFYRSTQFGLAGAEIPLETIRLKRIRDGRQAYALLKMRQASHGDATSFVTGIYPEMGTSSPTAQSYDAAREALLLAGEGTSATTAPTNVQAVADDGQATIRWTPPAELAGVLQEYVVRTHEGATACTTTGLECTADELMNGKSYTFTVTAVTSAGASDPSAPSPAVTPQLPQIMNVSPPSIQTQPRYTARATADPGAWDGRWGADDISVAYQWRRNGQPIAGATHRTYRPTRADVGELLSVAVTASGPGYRPLTRVSAARRVGRATIAIRETAANRDARQRGVVKGRAITLTFLLGSAANGGRAQAVLAGSSVGSATVSSGRLVITLHTARAPRLTRGTSSFKIRYAGTTHAEPASRWFSLRIR